MAQCGSTVRWVNIKSPTLAAESEHHVALAAVVHAGCYDVETLQPLLRRVSAMLTAALYRHPWLGWPWYNMREKRDCVVFNVPKLLQLYLNMASLEKQREANVRWGVYLHQSITETCSIHSISTALQCLTCLSPQTGSKPGLLVPSRAAGNRLNRDRNLRSELTWVVTVITFTLQGAFLYSYVDVAVVCSIPYFGYFHQCRV